MSDFGKRLNELITYKAISKSEIARVGKISEKLIFNYIKGTTTPKVTFVENILAQYPDINARWFITGEKPMLNSKAYKESVDNYQNVKEAAEKYNSKIETLEIEIKYLKDQVKNLEEIIDLLKNKKPN